MSEVSELQSRKGGKRERTRATLIAAAHEVFTEKGVAAASLDEIAARAGMTKGAIYSNFRNKAELLLAVITARGLTIETLEVGETLRELLGAFAREFAALLGRARGEGRLLAEFQLQALADPDLRRLMTAIYDHSFTNAAAVYGGLKDLKPGVSPRGVAVAVQSLGLGLLAQSFMSPDDVTEDAVVQAFEALASGLSTSAAR